MRFYVYPEGHKRDKVYEGDTPALAVLSFCKEKEEDDPSWSGQDHSICVDPADDATAKAFPGWSRDEDGDFRCFKAKPHRVVTWDVKEWTGFYYGGIPKADGGSAHG